MTERPIDEPSTHADADGGSRLRKTSRTLLLMAAGVLILLGAASLAAGAGGGGMLLLLAGIGLAAAGAFRIGSPERAAATSPAPAVTAADVDAASALATRDLTIDEICRLSRPGYSWWPEAHRASFRDELGRRLGIGH